MGAILDTLILGPQELSTLQRHYPEIDVTNLTESDQLFQHYQVIIQDEEEDDYYHFLVDNRMAMSSRNFHSRIRSDERFAFRMELRMKAIEGSDG